MGKRLSKSHSRKSNTLQFAGKGKSYASHAHSTATGGKAGALNSVEWTYPIYNNGACVTTTPEFKQDGVTCRWVKVSDVTPTIGEIQNSVRTLEGTGGSINATPVVTTEGEYALPLDGWKCSTMSCVTATLNMSGSSSYPEAGLYVLYAQGDDDNLVKGKFEWG